MDSTSLPSNPNDNVLAVQATIIEELTTKIEMLRNKAELMHLQHAGEIEEKNKLIDDLLFKKKILENNVHAYAVSGRK